LNGLVLLGDGKGAFKPLSILQSGLYIPGDGKALIKCRGIENNYLLAASQNSGPVKIFSSKSKQKMISIFPGDKYCMYRFKNGKKRKEEFYTGQSYLSQSTPFILSGENISSIEITNMKGEKRIVQ